MTYHTPIAGKILKEKISSISSKTEEKISWYKIKHGNTYVNDDSLKNDEKCKDETQKVFNDTLNSLDIDGNKDNNNSNNSNISNNNNKSSKRSSVENPSPHAVHAGPLKKKMKFSDFILYSGGNGRNLRHFQKQYWHNQQQRQHSSTTIVSPIVAAPSRTITEKEASSAVAAASTVEAFSPTSSQAIQRKQQQFQQRYIDIQQLTFKQHLQHQKELQQFFLQNQQKEKEKLQKQQQQQQQQLLIHHLEQKRRQHHQHQQQYQQYQQQAQQQQQIALNMSNSNKHDLFKIKRER
jgi:hypothetical protein